MEGRVYENTLRPVVAPGPLLADWPRFVSPVVAATRFEGPPLVEDPGADLAVRAWRWSYNARGIVELPNRLRLAHTAVVVVHPWGIDDGQGWVTPEPAGVCDMCTREKNELAAEHTTQVIKPLVGRLRTAGAGLVLYSLRGAPHAITERMYRTFGRAPPTPSQRMAAQASTRRTRSTARGSGSSPCRYAVTSTCCPPTWSVGTNRATRRSATSSRATASGTCW
jgi:hypothetical protein